VVPLTVMSWRMDSQDSCNGSVLRESWSTGKIAFSEKRIIQG
jgi:hypothetical protein